jgi:CheY-like chemotaxis protein
VAAERALAPVHRLHPIRVLVVGPDRRFLRVAHMLLERSGFEVETAESSRGVAKRVVQGRIDVVIVDASNSLTLAARAAAAIGALELPVKVVTVADRPERSSLENLRLLPKWSGFDEIVAEVETAYAPIP